MLLQNRWKSLLKAGSATACALREAVVVKSTSNVPTLKIF